MSDQLPACWYRISAKALILDNQRRFLLVKENNGLRDFPGWWLDHGETPQEGIRREIHEEMWLEMLEVSKTPSYFLTAKNQAGDKYIANIFYETTVKDLNFSPSQECVEIGFFTAKEAKNLQAFPNVYIFADLYDV